MALPPNSVSAINAAKILGIAPITMRKIMRSGMVKGVKIKKDWYIDLDSLKDYLDKNGSGTSNEIVINGEKAIRVVDFAKMFKLTVSKTNSAISQNGLSVVKHNGVKFIPKSEIRRYKRRFVEHLGKKILSVEEAARKLEIPPEQILMHISENELTKVTVENKPFVYVDELAKLQERLSAGIDFLSIPQNGRKRRDF